MIRSLSVSLSQLLNNKKTNKIFFVPDFVSVEVLEYFLECFVGNSLVKSDLSATFNGGDCCSGGVDVLPVLRIVLFVVAHVVLFDITSWFVLKRDWFVGIVRGQL